MNFPIKIKFWDNDLKVFYYFTIDSDLDTVELYHVINEHNISKPYIFTGLEDMDGEKIYLGDIIELMGDVIVRTRGEVIYQDGCFCFKAPWIKKRKGKETYYPELKYYIDMTFIKAKVIGHVEEKELRNG
jgi:hypothetical protein